MKAINKGGYKSYRLMPTSDPMQAIGRRLAKKQAATKKAAKKKAR